MHDELAERMLNPSIIEQAFEAAKQYPYLRIVCPWCGNSVMGAGYRPHAEAHIAALANLQADTPSHWLAL